MTELSLSEGVFFRLIVFLIVNLLKSDNHVPNVSFRMATKQEIIHCCQWFKICVLQMASYWLDYYGSASSKVVNLSPKLIRY